MQQNIVYKITQIRFIFVFSTVSLTERNKWKSVYYFEGKKSEPRMKVIDDGTLYSSTNAINFNPG